MSGAVKIAFGPVSAPKGGALVLFAGADMKPAAAVTAQFGDLEPLIRAAANASNFKGTQRTAQPGAIKEDPYQPTFFPIAPVSRNPPYSGRSSMIRCSS